MFQSYPTSRCRRLDLSSTYSHAPESLPMAFGFSRLLDRRTRPNTMLIDGNRDLRGSVRHRRVTVDHAHRGRPAPRTRASCGTSSRRRPTRPPQDPARSPPLARLRLRPGRRQERPRLALRAGRRGRRSTTANPPSATRSLPRARPARLARDPQVELRADLPRQGSRDQGVHAGGTVHVSPSRGQLSSVSWYARTSSAESGSLRPSSGRGIERMQRASTSCQRSGTSGS